MKALIAALCIVVCLTSAAVAGCGTSVAPSAGAGSTAAVTESATPQDTSLTSNVRSHPRTLTAADDGRTVRLRVGQTVVVLLASGGLMWDIPKSSGSALSRMAASGGYPTTRPARAAFRAERRGTSEITSITDARCLHSTPRCAIPQRLWRVVVIVR